MSNHKIKEYFDIVQGSKEWQDLRAGIFTSSKMSVLFTNPNTKAKKEAGELSETAKTYINEKATELFYGMVAVNEDFKQTNWGNTYEMFAKEAYQEVTGMKTKDVSFVRIVGEEQGTSPDTYVENEGLAEFKCPYSMAVHFANLQLKKPEDLKNLNLNRYIQGQHQMFVTKRKWCDFTSFDPRLIEHEENFRKSIHILRLTPDNYYQDLFSEKVEQAAQYRDYLLQKAIG